MRRPTIAGPLQSHTGCSCLTRRPRDPCHRGKCKSWALCPLPSLRTRSAERTGNLRGGLHGRSQSSLFFIVSAGRMRPSGPAVLGAATNCPSPRGPWWSRRKAVDPHQNCGFLVPRRGMGVDENGVTVPQSAGRKVAHPAPRRASGHARRASLNGSRTGRSGAGSLKEPSRAQPGAGPRGRAAQAAKARLRAGCLFTVIPARPPPPVSRGSALRGGRRGGTRRTAGRLPGMHSNDSALE